MGRVLDVSDRDTTARPLQLDLQRGKELRVKWSDGHESVYPLVLLRRSCPCATCRAEREERAKNPMVVVSAGMNIQDMVTASGAELVGRYALQIVWKDGHDTGIYDFVALRALCPCPECEKTRSGGG